MPGISPKAIVIDGRAHMFGRLASIVAKLILNGNKVKGFIKLMLSERMCCVMRSCSSIPYIRLHATRV